MLSTIIIDDELPAINYLSSVIKEFIPSLNIVATATLVSEGIKLIKFHNPDIIFLDIQLPDASGFDLLDALPELDSKVVMVTAYDQYAIKAIKARVSDYLLKPVDPDELIETIEYLLSESKVELDNHQKTITVNYRDKDEFIAYSDIVMLKSDGSYTEIFLKSGEIKIASKNLSHYQKEICPSIFFRCHRSFIINLNFIENVSKGDNRLITLINDFNAELSRNKRKELLELLNL
jgi:two-component system, LytTR family, response regulator